MKKTFNKCIAAYLIAFMAFGVGYAQDDDQWGDFDASVPLSTFEPEPAPSYTPSYSEPEPSYGEPPSPSSYSEPEQKFYGVQEPSFSEPEPEPPSYGGAYGDYNVDDSYVTSKVDKMSAGFIKVVRHPRNEMSGEFQDAVIEGLQVSTAQGRTSDEVIVTCYFIFRDKPTSYFYDINRKEKKLMFEFVDARTGTSPIAALEQPPLKEIVIEESQIDANKDIKGLNPEWHDMIRITFDLAYVPVLSVSDEANIISFNYRWTTDPAKYQQYIETNKFPLVFWISGGVLGAIGIGTLTYFLLPKKEDSGPTSLSTSGLPPRPTIPDRSQRKAKF